MDSTCPQQAGHSLRSLQNDNEQKQFAPPTNCSLLIATLDLAIHPACRRLPIPR